MNKTQDDAVKETYRKQRDGFKSKRDEILKQIKEKLGEVSALEETIRTARPKITKGGGLLCPRCDTISMEYEGRTPQGGLSGGDDVYTCKICGLNNLDSTYIWDRDALGGVGYDKSAAVVLKRR